MKMKKYVITLSEYFPVAHPRKGEPTEFVSKFNRASICYKCATTIGAVCSADCQCYRNAKFHTLRGNYDLWHKRFEEIYAGRAYLSVRIWSGKPYASKQIEIARLTKDDGIGMQLLCFAGNNSKKDRELHRPIVGGTTKIDYRSLAVMDGLSLQDWEDWFTTGDYDLSEPMVIIHFTSFRY